MKCEHVLSAGAVALVAAATVHAQCDPTDFDNFTAGTVITDQYPGVVFSAVPQSCGGSPDPVIATATGGTVSGTRCLTLQTGCPDFSPDYLRMVFDVPQRVVLFAMGSPDGFAGLDFVVRAYDEGGVLLTLHHYDTLSGVYLHVGLGGSGSPAVIKRVEVESTVGLFEAIDDLQFGSDTTPPSVVIDAPSYRACGCDSIPIVATVGDDDGTYECDTLSYRPVGGGAWVDLVSGCGDYSGTLIDWDTTDVDDGEYYLRLVGRNECGLVATDTTVVRVDKRFDSIAITAPNENDVVCGVVDIVGTAWDQCFDAYVLEYSGPDPYVEFHSSTSRVTSCVLGSLDTRTVPDGLYKVRLTGTDDCGNTAQRTVQFTIDNSVPFCECTPDINQDGRVDFADILLILSNWG